MLSIQAATQAAKRTRPEAKEPEAAAAQKHQRTTNTETWGPGWLMRQTEESRQSKAEETWDPEGTQEPEATHAQKHRPTEASKSGWLQQAYREASRYSSPPHALHPYAETLPASGWLAAAAAPVGSHHRAKATTAGWGAKKPTRKKIKAHFLPFFRASENSENLHNIRALYRFSLRKQRGCFDEAIRGIAYLYKQLNETDLEIFNKTYNKLRIAGDRVACALAKHPDFDYNEINFGSAAASAGSYK